MYLAIFRTLWSRGSIRCVLVQQFQPPLLAVQVFSGTQAVYTELVDRVEEACEVATELWPCAAGLTLPKGLVVPQKKRPKRPKLPGATADIEQLMAALLNTLPPPADDKRTQKPTRRRSGARTGQAAALTAHRAGPERRACRRPMRGHTQDRTARRRHGPYRSPTCWGRHRTGRPRAQSSDGHQARDTPGAVKVNSAPQSSQQHTMTSVRRATRLIRTDCQSGQNKSGGSMTFGSDGSTAVWRARARGSLAVR